MWQYFHMEIDEQQNASGLPGARQGTANPNQRPLNTAMWLSSMDPVSSQIMESLITTNVGPQALSSSFNLFHFIFQNFENFANELNRNPIDENFKVKIERPTQPKERPNPNNAFEMIRTMRGHISVGMWALILYCKEGYLSVHLLPGDFIASIIDDKMGDFPAYLEIVQQDGQPGSWQIENKPIVIEVIPGLIRHLVEHLVRVSRGEAPANERFSFFTPRKTKETTAVFSMPASVQAAIAGEVLPESSSTNGGTNSVQSYQSLQAAPQPYAPPQPPAQIQPQPQTVSGRLTRSQTIKNMMVEARRKADSEPATSANNQIYYNSPNQATIAQEKTVAVQQFSLPNAPDLNFKNPNSSVTNAEPVAPPPFLAPPAGLFGGGPGVSAGPGMMSPPASLLTESGADPNTIATPSAFNPPQSQIVQPQSPFARPASPPDQALQSPSTSATSLSALLNNASASTEASTASSESVAPVPQAPPQAPVPPPTQPASLSQSGVMPAPPPPPGQAPRPLPPPAPFSAPPPPPSPNQGNFSAGSPPPMPASAPPSPRSMPSTPFPQVPPPPPPAPAPNATPASQSTAVPVVPFPNFTQTSMPAAPVPESVILGEAANIGEQEPEQELEQSQSPSGQSGQSPLSLFDDEEEAQELQELQELQDLQDLQEPQNEALVEEEILGSDQNGQGLDLFESNEAESENQDSSEILESQPTEQEGGELIFEQEEQQEETAYGDDAGYENAAGYLNDGSDEQQYQEQYEQGEYQEQQSYDSEGNYQDYATGESQQGDEEVQYEQYETDESYQMNGEVNGFAASIQDPLDSPEALTQIMEQSQRVVRDGCFQILGELDQVLDSLRAAAQVAMHNDNIQAVTDIMQHSKQIKALRERLVSFKEENIKED